MDKRPQENYGLPGLPTEVEYLRADRQWLIARLADYLAIEAMLIRARNSTIPHAMRFDIDQLLDSRSGKGTEHG